MPDFTNHGDVVKLLDRAQEFERDRRDNCREQAHFISDRDGQWEQSIVQKFGNRPRYQFDKTSRVINDIAATIEDKEFVGRVDPAGAEATKEVAETYDRLVRSIQHISKAECTYKKAGRRIISYGFDAWRIITDWADVDAFEQDLLVDPIANALDRVWMDPDAELQDRSDAEWGFVNSVLSQERFKEIFPKLSIESLPEAKSFEVYADRRDEVVVSDFYYIKKKKKILHLLSDNKVVDDDTFQKLQQEYLAKGVTSVRQRSRDIPVCFMRKLDGGKWLGEEKETTFAYIPIVTVYGNFDILENKLVYFGETEKLMDPQRVYNYARSREIEEGAIAPRRKLMMTTAQGKGHEEQIRTMNINADPVQFWNPDGAAPPPYELGGAQINPALAQAAATSNQDMLEISGNFQPSRGEGLAGHSGKAYELLQAKSEDGNDKYLDALIVGIDYTARILVDAIPKVYDTRGRQVRLLNEDGTSEFASINEEIFDQESKQVVVENNLAQGHYDITITAGPQFRNRKVESVNAMLEVARVRPELLDEGADVFINAMDAPGMKTIGERVRANMIREGRIPVDQLTDEEKEKVAQEIEQQQQPSEQEQATLQVFQAEVERTMQGIASEQQKNQLLQLEAFDKHEKAMADTEKTMAETLKTLKEAAGADVVLNKNAAQAYDNVAESLESETETP